MNVMKQMLLEKIADVQKSESVDVEKDMWRLQYHLMPPVGWLNDPNGLCQYQGKYYVFFQYSPFDARGGLKVWGQYISEDLIHWEYVGTPLLPDSPYDCHGVYSGSAFIEDGSLELFYTGNIKYDGDYDYTNDGREAYTMYTRSQDGKVFEDKECLMSLEDYPEDYTCHIRDPKVWKRDQDYYMVLGGRRKDNQGTVLLMRSDDKKKWTLCNEITTPQSFGYMWECPDLFEIGGKCFLSVSPQGLQRGEYKFQNIYQSGYFPVEGDYGKSCVLGEFTEWDMGFDFYAPQTFQDEKGRRILIAWAGLPDIDGEYSNPTVDKGWQHTLTVPREITLKDDKLLQYPVEEISLMRRGEIPVYSGQVLGWDSPCFDWEISGIDSQECAVIIEDQCSITFSNGIFTLAFSGDLGSGRESRKAKVDRLEHLRILGDTSMLEIYLNNGEVVFTTRYYPRGIGRKLELRCDGIESRIWELSK